MVAVMEIFDIVSPLPPVRCDGTTRHVEGTSRCGADLIYLSYRISILQLQRDTAPAVPVRAASPKIKPETAPRCRGAFCFLRFMKRIEAFRPWQTWQRPTLPSLEA